VTIQLGNFQSDASGHFQSIVNLPNRQPTPETQYIRSITRANVGGPELSKNGKDTWDKIIETVFLALLATTFGTLFAIPVSFLAAKNLMKDVVSPLASVTLSLIAWPIGIGAGWLAARGAHWINDQFGQTTLLLIAGLIIMPLLTFFAMRIGLPPTDTRIPTTRQRLGRYGALAVSAVAGIVAALLISQVVTYLGEFVTRVPALEFLGSFFVTVSDMVATFLALVVALATGALFSSWAERLGHWMTDTLSISVLKTANLILSGLAGALMVLIVAYIIEWLYDINNPLWVFVIPAILGALGGLLVAARLPHKGSLPVGMAIYTSVRAVMNVLRSIEAFIWAIIFVVLVSTGPFAGTLALTLHTVAALGKLYSEQVESIMPGPLEAIKATGATRLQTIIYGVIPQIIPPYISFTMYRWDINVRMSTIIGFAGGGGIGFLLQQNINLLNYRAASTQMIAITVVVWAMDYLSSVLRERYV
ncbi:MAG TPA: ABC transporter permease subunit, partial [Anaerolineales bacterium]|nr:ABC transporter permease subunit [Anaerolineales bacterium]